MKELIKAEEEKTLFIGRHGNECIYVVRAVSREAAMHLLNEVTGFEGDAWDLDVADNENGNVIDTGNNDFLREQLKELQADLLDMSDKELVECRSLLLERINWCMTAILES